MSKTRSMSFFSSAVFWGVIIILIGLSIITKQVFGYSFPLFKIIIGLFFIYIGIKILSSGFYSNSSTVVFGESKMNYDDSQQQYSVVFGNGQIDLFKLPEPTENKKVEVNVIFGNGTVIVNDSIPMQIELSSAFGSAETPDKTVSALGKSTYFTSSYKQGVPFYFVKASVVFGRLQIVNKKW